MVIRYSDGSYIEGALQRLEGGTVRAAVAGIDHVVEYTLVRDRWTSNRGVVVTFEFPIEGGMHLFNIPAMTGDGDGHCAAGGDCALRRMSGLGAGPVN